MRRLWQLVTIIFLVFLLSNCSLGEKKSQAQGYIEGRYTYMTTSVSGILKVLHVARGAQVKQGDELLQLEEQPESDAYQAAQQNLQQAIAARDAILPNVEFARLTYERYKTLVPKNAIQQSALDNAKSNYNSLQAQLTQANATVASNTATVAQSKWTKEQKVLTAPVDALVFDTYYRLGEYTEANKPIISLLAPADIKAIFYVNEKQLANLKIGKKVTVNCDRCQPVDGKINFISPVAEYTPPVIYSNETNSKLIYRIEAEFAPQVAVRFHPGQPIYVTYTSHE